MGTARSLVTYIIAYNTGSRQTLSMLNCHIFSWTKEKIKEHANEQILKLNRHIKCFVTALGFSPSEEKGKSSQLVPKELKSLYARMSFLISIIYH